jgi:hypothetical protein
LADINIKFSAVIAIVMAVMIVSLAKVDAAPILNRRDTSDHDYIN